MRVEFDIHKYWKSRQGKFMEMSLIRRKAGWDKNNWKAESAERSSKTGLFVREVFLGFKNQKYDRVMGIYEGYSQR
jgi:hypothetical protein